MKPSEEKNILIVDDSKTMRMLLKLMLGKSHLRMSVIEAVNGSEALEKLDAHPVDLVITDMMMPEMDGCQLIAAIRERLKKEMPILIVTTLGEEADRDRGMSLGANGYLTKPVNGPQLNEAIERFLLSGHA